MITNALTTTTQKIPNFQMAQKPEAKQQGEQQIAFKGNPEQDELVVDTKRQNVEIHNAKVRASGYTALFGPFATIFYALKDPAKMATENRKDQTKEATDELEIQKQKTIKEAQVKASLVTLVCEAALGIGGLIPFIGYKCVENPENPSKIF